LDVTSIAGTRYDYCLGGKDNFTVDREAAEEFVKVMPGNAGLNTKLAEPVTFRPRDQVAKVIEPPAGIASS
jgi:S-adenosyl methyltransferase